MAFKLFTKRFDEIRTMWPCRALAHAENEMGMIVLSVIAHSYPDEYGAFLFALGYRGVTTPFLTTTAVVNKKGQVTAKVLWRDRGYPATEVLFENEIALRDAFRRLADQIKMRDDERTEMFAAVKLWCCADHRLDPNMDPQDPDAKRLTDGKRLSLN